MISMAILERVDRVESKVDKIWERLSLLEESYSTIRATVERTKTRNIELSKMGKVCFHCLDCLLNY